MKYSEFKVINIYKNDYEHCQKYQQVCTKLSKCINMFERLKFIFLTRTKVAYKKINEGCN